jgi:hypothetical protein
MRTSLKKDFRMFLFILIFAPFALQLQSLAQDNTNAAKIDLSLWGDMYQVMGGMGTGSPFAVPGTFRIGAPIGIYAYVLVDDALVTARNSGMDSDTALKNYFSFLLSQPYISGILFAAPWSLLNPHDPKTTKDPYYWKPLDDAFEAIDDWNKNKRKQGEPAKTLQLNVTPGFNSPPWLYQPQFLGNPPSGYLSSCDGLFVTPPTLPTSPSCGYTTIFVQTEVPQKQIGHARLPLPWNRTYQTKWKEFLIALNNHIQSKPTYISDFVSIAVAGPTATSSEIILPNEHNAKEVAPLQLPWTPYAGYSTTGGINVLSAWNCLLANNYGGVSNGLPYLDSDRAFIEAWATAIDLFGEVFNGITLIIATGNGLPNFQSGSETPGCGLHNTNITFPNSSSPGYAKLSLAHPGFVSDCGTKPGTTPLFPMDCAAEVAIVAYFAEPSVVGANVKAIQENALSASDDVVSTLLSLSNASVKWLSKNSDGLILLGPQPDPTAPISTYPEGPKGIPTVSRIMGGLQFALPAAVLPATQSTPGNQKVGCELGPPCGELSAEQALVNALKVFFRGTSRASAFDAPTTIMNNGLPVQDAPMNYLQIWTDDIKYAAGFGGCSTRDIMTKSESCVPVQQRDMPQVKIGATEYTAQGLLVLAGKNIPTTKLAFPLFWYNKCKNQTRMPYCDWEHGYYQRGAVINDSVCVTGTQQNAAVKETLNGKSMKQTLNHYSTNATDHSVAQLPYNLYVVPYGVCEAGYIWRQAYMGDYVCVTPQEQEQILNENQDFYFGVGVRCH